MRVRNKKTKKQGSLFDLEIHPEVKRGIFNIFLFLISFLGVLSFFKLAGQLGILFDNALAVVFGYDRLIFPIILTVFAILFLSPSRRPKLKHLLGALLLVLSINGLVHILTFDYAESLSGAGLGQGGGYAGLLLSYPLDKWLGFFGGTLVLFALVMISLMLISQTFVYKLLFLIQTLLISIVEYLKSFGNLFKRKLKNKNIKDEEENQFINKKLAEAPLEENKLLEIAEEKKPDELALIDEPKAQKLRRAPIHMPLNLLLSNSTSPNAGDTKAAQLIIQKTLENFGIEIELGKVSVGPSVAQYTLKPAEGVKLSKITALSNDLALALAAHPIRIEAPIPGKSLVGIEVPNQQIARVSLRELLESDEYKKSSAPLTIALGKDVAGKAWCADLARMPHMLVAGATGSGKTVALNTIIISLLYRNQPDDLKLILVDPKRVDLPIYNGIPHLLAPVVTDVPKIVNALRWTIKEMERRFNVLAKVGKRDLASYNQTADDKIPYLVVVIDELADIMVAAASEVEASIIRLAQMARAVGIHLIIATQRPSVDIITGLIKANITSRAAFSVASQTDSRTILDTAGAEKLMGRGDMLFTSAELSKPRRLQGAFVSDEEISRICEYLKGNSEPTTYNETITEKQMNIVSDLSLPDGDDPLLNDAKDTVVIAGKASASLLQRRLRIGYARAARLLDIMEEKGIVGPGDGAKPREVLISINPSDTINNIDFEQ